MADRIRVVHLMRFPRAHLFSIERVFAQIRRHLPRDIDCTAWHCQRSPYAMPQRLADARAASRIGADVFHVTGDAHYLSWFLPGRRAILTIHDVESLDRMHGIKRALFRLLWFTIPIRRSAAVIAISAATREALERHVSLAGKRVEIIPDPLVAAMPRKTMPFRTDRPTVLHIGTKANKNLARHVEALEGLDIRLIVIGKIGQSDRLLLQNSGLEWDNRADLSEEQLAATFREADLLLFASLIEGFGLPILEAQAVGIPVITSDRSSMPEAAGEGALLVDPTDVAAIRDAVLRIIADADLRTGLVQSGFRNLERFAPEKIAGDHARLYRDIAWNADR